MSNDLIIQGEDVASADLRALHTIGSANSIERIGHVAHQAFRLTGADANSRDAVKHLCDASNLDFAFVPSGRTLADIGLIAMDMDSTLITIECIDEIADFIGRKSEVSAVTARAMRGEIDWAESLRQRVLLLAGLDEFALLRVYDERLALSPGAATLIDASKKSGIKTIDQFIQGFADKNAQSAEAVEGKLHTASEHLRLTMPDVVESLQRDATHQRGVAHDDRDALHPVTEVTRLRQALGDRQPRPGVTAVEHVVLRFRPARESTDAVQLAQGPESRETTGEELVGVGLVPGVPDDAVAGRFKESMQGDGQFDDTERGPEVPARHRDGTDDRFADLGGQFRKLDPVEATQVGRAAEIGQDGHGWWCSAGGRLGDRRS